MRRRPGERHDNWLLIKQHDDGARGERNKDILVEMPLSVKTGRTMDEIAQHKRKVKRKIKRKKAMAKKKRPVKQRKRKVKRAKRR